MVDNIMVDGWYMILSSITNVNKTFFSHGTPIANDPIDITG